MEPDPAPRPPRRIARNVTRAPRGLIAYRAAVIALLTATDEVGEAEARLTMLLLLRADGIEIPIEITP